MNREDFLSHVAVGHEVKSYSACEVQNNGRCGRCGDRITIPNTWTVYQSCCDRCRDWSGTSCAFIARKELPRVSTLLGHYHNSQKLVLLQLQPPSVARLIERYDRIQAFAIDRNRHDRSVQSIIELPHTLAIDAAAAVPPSFSFKQLHQKNKQP